MKKTAKTEFITIINIVAEAGKIALEYFHKKKNDVTYSLKDDCSPVTIADMKINKFLHEELNFLYPDIKIFSEEEDFDKNKCFLKEKKLFIIDPIDGTSSFIKGSDEFTINLSLKIDQHLVLSIIYSPIHDILYLADQNKLYKYSDVSNYNLLKKQQILYSKNYSTLNIIKIIATRREDEFKAIKNKFKFHKLHIDYLNISSSIKFCFLAEGKADIYLRMAKIKLWDVAAGFHIANNAGLEVRNLHGGNIMDYFLSSSYLTNIQHNNFRIDEFIIKSPALKINY
jgi:3'(2'), 5'-bisphosphate nucleotidase